MSARPGQIIVGDHVLTPSGREARVRGYRSDGRLDLEYVHQVDDNDSVVLPEGMLYLLLRPRLRRPG